MEPGLQIGFSNIIGFLEEKMFDETYKWETNKYDILFLCETWLHKRNINNINHPNGTSFWEIKEKKERSPIKGVLMYFRSQLNKIVSAFENENTCWVKIGEKSEQ